MLRCILAEPSLIDREPFTNSTSGMISSNSPPGMKKIVPQPALGD
jgi:hypothetical protein